MTIAIYGIGVSKGIAIGSAFIVPRDHIEVSEYTISVNDLDQEIDRYRKAILGTISQFNSLRALMSQSVGANLQSIIDTHIMILKDASFAEGPITIIQTRLCNAEFALKEHRDHLVRVFNEIDDDYLRSRKDDIVHVSNEIFRSLNNADQAHPPLTPSSLRGKIAIVDEITPANLVLLSYRGVAGIVSGVGGPLSHASIMARNMQIPAIVGIQHSLDLIKSHDEVVINGQDGSLLLESDTLVRQYYEAAQCLLISKKEVLTNLRGKVCKTLDNKAIHLYANVDKVDDLAPAIDAGAIGVGLFRTELLYLNREQPLGEEEQYQIYRDCVLALPGLPLTIRTLDLGSDKAPEIGIFTETPAHNPALGLRAIRLCLKEVDLLKPQLRALLRASTHGLIKIMLPMLSTRHEIVQVRHIMEECKSELAKKLPGFNPHIELGGMIEVPAAALMAFEMAKELDFLSIGTNDLIQYTLAIDRTDQEVNYLYQPAHPAVLKLIHYILRAGRRANCPVTMCGEMAGDTLFTRLLLGMGLTNFSMHPINLLEVKNVILASDSQLLNRRVRLLLNELNSEKLPEHLEALNKL